QKIVAAVKKVMLVIVIVVIVIASAYLGYKGLVWLSDWMNENEARQRRKYSRN
ncbi:hypothetical protein MIMGU_mgv1a0016062mg, partial [Erythranthe guttata]